ncbi:phosphoadenosine phosphosulfate reductase family protein [Humidesulfovibrio sp.]
MPLKHLNALPPLAPSAPLAQKLARSREILAALPQHLDPAHIAVAYTGGKDSGVTLALWRDALAQHLAASPANDLAEPVPTPAALAAHARTNFQTARRRGPLRAISVDTGLKFPQVTAFRDRLCADWGVALTIARPQVDLHAYPVAVDKLSCCRELKIAPLGRAVGETQTQALLTGLRRDEHPSRALRPYAEHRPATELCPEHWQVNVILDWTEMDVWAFVTGENLPYCELYHEGYRSLGCMPCTRLAGQNESERAGRDPDKERNLAALKALGYF